MIGNIVLHSAGEKYLKMIFVLIIKICNKNVSPQLNYALVEPCVLFVHFLQNTAIDGKAFENMIW